MSLTPQMIREELTRVLLTPAEASAASLKPSGAIGSWPAIKTNPLAVTA